MADRKRCRNRPGKPTDARHGAAREALGRIWKYALSGRRMAAGIETISRGDSGDPGNREQVHLERWEPGDPDREKCVVGGRRGVAFIFCK